MLKELHISNYVLIESLDIAFHSGFSVLTGQTGAGKSIIIGAVNLLLGSRADARQISYGKERCLIEGHFDIQGYGLEPFFQDNSLDFDPTDTILRRELTQSGKSRAFINDTPVTLAQLKELGSHLIDVHSQHQNLMLGTEQFQISTLDAIAGNSGLREQYVALWENWKSLSRQLDELKKRVQSDSTDIEYLRFQLSGIENAHLKDGEQEQLEQESAMLEHAQDIKHELFQAVSLLDNEQNGGINGQLRQAVQTLTAAAKYWPQATELATRTDSCLIEMRDIHDSTLQALESVNFDPQRMEQVTERLDLIYSLEKKHHKDSIAALLEYAKSLSERISSVDNFEQDICELEKKVAAAASALQKAAGQLSKSRVEASATVEHKVKETLMPLGIPNVQFHIDIAQRDSFERDGHDSVRFMFSANLNQPMQELGSVASGGEIARVMLCIKALLAGAMMMPTVIFDEIDTGVSGAVAQHMASLMKQMSAHDRQVLAITHLPQIAAMGSTHYKVFKTDSIDGTHSSITELDMEGRIREIAGMMSGDTLSQAALDNAKTLIEHG